MRFTHQKIKFLLQMKVLVLKDSNSFEKGEKKKENGSVASLVHLRFVVRLLRVITLT